MPRSPIFWDLGDFELDDDDFDPGAGFCVRCGTLVQPGQQACDTCLVAINAEPTLDADGFCWPADDTQTGEPLVDPDDTQPIDPKKLGRKEQP